MTIEEIENRLEAIRADIQNRSVDLSQEQLDAYEKEVNELTEKRSAITAAAEKRSKLLKDIGEGREGSPSRSLIIPSGKDQVSEVQQQREEAEKRGNALREKRSVTIASTGVILPEYKATDLKPTFNEVSSLLDRVTIKVLPGGESYDQAYMTGYGEGGYTDEAGDPTTADPTFAYAKISKTKITAYSEDTEELIKLPAINYDAEVMKGIRIAIRKKITKEILIGDGATGHFVGIFDDQATAISAATDISIAEIDETTLDEIMFSFGGNEDVEDVAVLGLNKIDLKAFKMLRDADGKKIYDVVCKGNVGTIDGVPYIINSACKAISAAATTTGQYSMFYGPLSNYLVAIFSDLEVSRSTDYKFKEGMICHRGVYFGGGNVIAKNGFLRVKKG